MADTMYPSRWWKGKLAAKDERIADLEAALDAVDPRRVNELLEANNLYLERARAAEAKVIEAEKERDYFADSRDRLNDYSKHLQSKLDSVHRAAQDRYNEQLSRLVELTAIRPLPPMMIPAGSILLGDKADAYRRNRDALKTIRLFLSYSMANDAKSIRDTVASLIPTDLGDK